MVCSKIRYMMTLRLYLLVGILRHLTSISCLEALHILNRCQTYSVFLRWGLFSPSFLCNIWVCLLSANHLSFGDCESICYYHQREYASLAIVQGWVIEHWYALYDFFHGSWGASQWYHIWQGTNQSPWPRYALWHQGWKVGTKRTQQFTEHFITFKRF